VLPTCLRQGMGVMAYSPLAGGWLSGKYRKGQEVRRLFQVNRATTQNQGQGQGQQSRLRTVPKGAERMPR
jgi:aryl-alcohol dehydrogenase-like predicted oxidoreductase